MKAYSILLPNEKAKTYSYVTLFILLINCLVFGFVFFNAPDNRIRNISLTATAISLTSLVFFLINFFTGKIPAYRPGISFIILSIFWFILGNYFLGLSVICFAVIGFFARKKFNVLFTEDKITYPSFPQKIYSWKEVSNVVLKDGILTIDLKNNKLIQAVIEQESVEQVDESAFNDFCGKQLAQHG